MLPQNGELQLEPTPTHSKKFKSFAQWMEARNIYVSTVLLAKPSKALEMLGYQCIIASLNLCFPITTWMTHDIKFCSLAAHPTLEYTAFRHMPCPHCGSMYCYPECCPFHADSSSTDANRQLPATGHATHSLPLSQHPQPPHQPQQPQSLSPNLQRLQ